MTHTIPGPKSFLNPPLHYHISQHETFQVVSGVGVFYMPYHPNPAMRTVRVSGEVADPELRKVHIPIGYFHRLQNPDPEVPLVLNVRFDVASYANEESFFRNFFGYIEDCNKSKVSPSVFQLCIWLHAVGAPLGVPIPGPQWFKRAVSRALTTLLGPIIGGMLGYKVSYPEYYDPHAKKI